MSLTGRDRKIVMFVVPLVVLLAYWFLLFSPKRQEASDAGKELTKQQEAQQQAEEQLSKLRGAQTRFASDYAQLVKLGKAIPTSVDMPTLIVQLDAAARGTGISFSRIAVSTEGASAAPPPAAPAAPGSGESAPAAPGGTPAQSTPGQQAEGAGSNVQAANAQNAENAQQSGVAPGDTQTSNSTGGSVPVGGGAVPPGGEGTGGCAPGLVCVPLEFEFNGRFFALADFFHRLKRFVRVVNDNVVVGGRLMTIDGLKFSSDDQSFPGVKAEVRATVYLSPEVQGVTAGATPAGPAGTVPASSSAPGSAPPPPTTPPTATATP